MTFDADVSDKGKVKAAMTHVQLEMLDKYGSEEARGTARELRSRIELLGKKQRTEQVAIQLDEAHDELKHLCKCLLQNSDITFGRFIADVQDERRKPITTPDRRKSRRGPREWRQAVRNRAGLLGESPIGGWATSIA
jgi:hypothetical protein